MSRWVKKALPALSRKSVLAKSIATKATPPWETANRYYDASAKELFKDGRYEAVRQLGGGRYSHVWLARDLQKETLVALKLLTNDSYGTDHDIFEIEILREITQKQAKLNDASDSHCIGLLDTFQLKGPNESHECIVMPVVGGSLSDQISRYADRRIPVSIMKQITKQLLQGLAFAHDNCQVIHTDLSPGNICFDVDEAAKQRLAEGKSTDEVTPTITENQPCNLKIIDFGVASWVHKHLSNNIQPVHLRAPEVILGAPWGPPVDIWSLGCLVIEAVKGHVAFPGAASERGTWTSEDDHLAQYQEVLGQMPRELLERSSKAEEYFDSEGNLLRIPTLRLTTLRDFLDGTQGPLVRPTGMTDDELSMFVDFVQGALMLDPEKRKSASELLQHEWLRHGS